MSDFPWLLLMIAVPAVGAAVVAALPKGRDLLAKQVSLAVSLLVLLLTVLATVAFDTGGARFQLTSSFTWIAQFGVDFAVGVDGIALVMLLLVGVLVPVVIGASWADTPPVDRSMTAYFAWLLLLEAMMVGVFAATDAFLFYVFFDNRGVDGAVNGMAAALGGSSSRLGRVQTGFVRSYALGMLGGAVLIAGALLAVTAG